VAIESVAAIIEVSDGSGSVRLRFDRGRECLRWGGSELRFDLSDELCAEAVVKPSTRLVTARCHCMIGEPT
jgi:hypothetical protein